MGALAFDYDNDGRTDLYVTYLLRPNLLYRNRGDGTFEEVGAKAGVALNDYCTSAAALDYDRDGLPDLYVLVYGHPDYGPTLEADNAPPNHLFRNNGDGTFTDVTKATRTGDTGWGLALQCADWTATAGPTSTSPTTSATTPTCTTTATARSATSRRKPGCSTPASAWASRSTTTTATGGSTSTCRTTRSR